MRNKPAVWYVQSWERQASHEPDVLKFCQQHHLDLTSLTSDPDDIVALAQNHLVEAVVAVIETRATATLGLVIDAFGVPLHVMIAGRRPQPLPLRGDEHAARIAAAAARGASPAEIARVLGLDLGEVAAMLAPVPEYERPSQRRPEPVDSPAPVSDRQRPSQRRPRRVR